MLLKSLGWWVLLMVASSAFAADIGLTRTEIVAKYGEPLGSMNAGTKDILTYANGKITLESGRVTRSTIREESETETSERKSVPSNSNVTISRSSPKWIDDLEAAKTEARKSGKKILALFWAPSADLHCPWAPSFDRFVMNNPAFLSQLDADYVLFRFMYATSSGEITMEQGRALQRAHDFKIACVGNAPIPAMAVVSADGRRSTKVEMDNVLAAKGGMQAFVTTALKNASSKTPATHNTSFNKFLLLTGGICGLFVVRWLIKRS